MTNWATLVDDLEEPLAQYLLGLGFALTTEQARQVAVRVEAFVRPYAEAERTAAVESERASLLAAVEARKAAYDAARAAVRDMLAALTSPHACVPIGNYCAAHDRDDPCPHAQAQTWLASEAGG